MAEYIFLILCATFFLPKIMYRFDPLRLLLFPLASISITSMVVRASYYRFVRGSVVWRGRKVRLEK